MSKTFKTAVKLNTLLQANASLAEEFLGLQEASCKLWQAVAAKRGKQELERRLASIGIALMLIAHKLQVPYSEAAVERRLRKATGKHLAKTRPDQR